MMSGETGEGKIKMGLINWFKDKAFMNLEHEVALLRAAMEGYQMQIEQMRGQIVSVRQRVSKNKSEEEDSSQEITLDQIMKMTGGQVPLEFMEKYKNSQN